MRGIVFMAALTGVWALAALAARFGAFAHARWTPLLLWALALALFVAALRRALGGAGLREVARIVETEHALRRGVLVGLVDFAER